MLIVFIGLGSGPLHSIPSVISVAAKEEFALVSRLQS